jgi:hypothetical protein
MKSTSSLLAALALLFIGLATGCTPSRGITASGKVTPKGAFKIGGNSSFNIATAPLGQIDDVTKSAVEAIENRDTIDYDHFRGLTRGLLAYSLDPVAPTSDFYIRYGLLKRVDIGYKLASGAHVFDAMYQFMGGLGTPENPGPAGMHGSIGLQYSAQDADLPGKRFLNRLGSIFNYELSRKDVLVPLVFSHSFGPEEQYGNISFGVVYGHTFINYGFSPGKLFVRVAGEEVRKLEAFMEKQNYSSYGAFLNAKIGFKYAYLLPAMSIYYQNYGTYNLFGLQQESYKGMSFIPSLGLQINLGYGKAGRKR